MKTNVHKRLGALSAVLVLAGAGLLGSASGASAQTASEPTRADTMAVTPLFDLNGTYTDGGAARPRISNVNDILTVDMSSVRRPNATGVVVNSDTIVVTFPDDTAYSAKLQLPGTIRWSNGSTWQKAKRVPDVRDLSVSGARSTLTASGFVLGTVGSFVDRVCNNIGTVGRQNPGAGAWAIPGSAVNVWIGTLPPTPCP